MAPSNRPTGQLTNDRWGRVKAVFLEALALAEAERRAFVAEACAGDEEVAREVESLLESDQAAGSFCETPAAGLLRSDGFVEMAPAVRLEPGTWLGGYEITGLIGAGGMGEV
jgi:eukaryotic-like serine/threonine-protein kinase